MENQLLATGVSSVLRADRLSLVSPFWFLPTYLAILDALAGRHAPSIYKDIIMPKGIGTYGSKRGRPPKKPKKGGMSRGR